MATSTQSKQSQSKNSDKDTENAETLRVLAETYFLTRNRYILYGIGDLVQDMLKNAKT